MATVKTPAVKAPGTAVTNWEERLGQLAKQAVATEASVSSGAFISTKAGILSYGGNPFAGNKFDAVVVDAIVENCYFDGPYNPDEPRSPVCYAFGRGEEGEELKPHEKAPSPQNATCKGCPKNEFKSADNKKGKACKNVRRLALISAQPLDAATLKKTDVVYLKVPVTSVKGWATYVRTLSALQKRPPLGVVTEISAAPHAKDQFHVMFNYKLNLTNELLSVVGPRYDMVHEDITFPYPEQENKPAAPAPKGKRKY